MKIFIAGPYTNPDPVVNTRNAILAAEQVVARGHTPFIPHLTMFWHLLAPHDLEWWYDYDMVWLRFCNGVLRLPGDSKGADREVEYANSIGIPVYLNVDELPKGLGNI